MEYLYIQYDPFKSIKVFTGTYFSSLIDEKSHEDLDQDLPRKWTLDMKIFYARINHRNLELNCGKAHETNFFY